MVNHQNFIPILKHIIYDGLNNFVPPRHGHDSSIVILNIETKERKYIASPEMLTNLEISPDGNFIATGGIGEDGHGSYTSLKLWDANSLKLIKELYKIHTNSPTRNIEFSDDSKTAVFNYAGNVLFYDTENFELKDKISVTLHTGIGNFGIINDDFVGVQTSNTINDPKYTNTTSIVNIKDDSWINLKDFHRGGGIAKVDKINNIFYAGLGGVFIYAWDLDKIFASSVEDEIQNQMKLSYQKGVLQIEYQNDNMPLNVKIHDLQGKLIQEIHEVMSMAKDSYICHVGLNRGAYLITIFDGRNEFSSKLLINE
jgi:WD40 repeat protein